MTKKNELDFNINESDLQKHAHIVYNAIQEHHARIDRLMVALNVNLSIKDFIESYSNLFGILPNKEIKYSESLLDNEDFRISVIYHLCFSNIMGCLLSWEAYMNLSGIVHKIFFESSDENLSVDSIMLKFFKVNPSILPKKYLVKTMRVDEFNKAVELISEELQNAKAYNLEDFSNYDEYFEYMKEIAEDLTSKCEGEYLFGVHELERFTCACISSKMKIPEFDPLYDIPEVRSHIFVDVENIKKFQSQIFEKIFGEK